MDDSNDIVAAFKAYFAPPCPTCGFGKPGPTCAMCEAVKNWSFIVPTPSHQHKPFEGGFLTIPVDTTERDKFRRWERAMGRFPVFWYEMPSWIERPPLARKRKRYKEW